MPATSPACSRSEPRRGSRRRPLLALSHRRRRSAASLAPFLASALLLTAGSPLLLAACGPSIRVVRLGRQLPPLPESCRTELLDIDPALIGLHFETLGHLVLDSSSSPGQLTDEERSALSREACRLGGEHLAAMLQTGQLNSFVVLRPRPGVVVRGGKVHLDRSRTDGGTARPASAPGRRPGPILAVFPLEDRTGTVTPALQGQLQEYLATRLVAASYRVIPTDQVQQRLRAEKREGYRACYEARCQIALGQALAAQKLAVVKILKLGERCTLTANIYDLRSETAERGASAVGDCGSEGLRQGIDGLVYQLTQPAPPDHP